MQLATNFEVIGRPAPQGSKVNLGRGGLKESSKYLDAWRNDVRNAALKSFGEALLRGPVFTKMVFMFPRPKSHYISNNPSRDLKPNAPCWHTSTPDVDKLLRSTNDALTGAVWVDDCCVAGALGTKIYTPLQGGAIISIYLLEGEEIDTMVKL